MDRSTHVRQRLIRRRRGTSFFLVVVSSFFLLLVFLLSLVTAGVGANEDGEMDKPNTKSAVLRFFGTSHSAEGEILL